MASTLTFMLFHKLLVILTILVIQAGQHQISAQLTWKMDPQDVIALRGETVMINCIVSGRNTTRSEQKFWWYKPDRGQYISRNWALYLQEPNADRFTVLLDKHLGVYSLVIRNISEYDGGQYQCIYRQNEEAESFSGLTTLTVLIPPAQGYPKCTRYPKSHLILSPLETKALHCPPHATNGALTASPPKNNLTVYHVWSHEKNVVHAFFLQNKTVLLSQAKPKGTPESKAPVAYCALDDPAKLGTYPERCKLIETSQKASARVTPAAAKPRLGENVNFTCHSEDVAVVTEYSWHFSRLVPSVGLSIHENGQVISIQKLSKIENPLKVTCEVTTEWGLTATATADLSTLSAENIIDINSTDADKPISPNDNSSSTVEEDAGSEKIAKVEPKEKGNTTIRNIGFLIGPGIGVLLLFIGAVFLACCIIKWKTKSKNLRKDTYKNKDSHTTVSLRTVTRNQNRNSSAMSRRFSDSYRYDGNHGPNSNYENFQAITAHQNSAFSRGVTSFQGQNGPNSPLEANVKVHIEMPNLSASLPALNMYKVSSNVNNGKDHPTGVEKLEEGEEPELPDFPPPPAIMETPTGTLTKGNSYQDLYVEPQPEVGAYGHRHGLYNRQPLHEPQANIYGMNGFRSRDNSINTYHGNELHNHDRPKKMPPPVVPRRKTPSISTDWRNGHPFSNHVQPLQRI